MPRLAKTPTPPPPGYVWIEEASQLTGLAVKTLYNYRHRGEGPPSITIGRKVAYSRDGITAYMKALANPEPDPDRAHESRPPEPRITRSRRPATAGV